MRRSSIILVALILITRTNLFGQNLYLQENARVFIETGAEVQVGGTLENNGYIDNSGELSLLGDLQNNSILNSIAGKLSFLGSGMQMIVSSSLDVSDLSIDGQSNEVMLNSEIIRVSGSIDFINGIMRIPEESRLIIEPDAETLGGNDLSYFDGAMTQLGTGFKYYPIGNNGLFTPISMEEIRGIDVTIQVSSTVPNDPAPIPADDIIGVSEHALWKVDLIDGFVDSILVSMEFRNADLNNFTNSNEIKADAVSPVLVEKESIDGIFRNLGVSELTDTDSMTFGRIIADRYIKPTLEQGRFIAVGLAPLLPASGSFYIPNAFSPNALDEDNKSFKVFGTRVINDGFELRIFNRSNVLVYQTDDYTEANQTGWNGRNQNNGNEEPSGLYYYTISYKLEDGIQRQEQNAIYLIR
ncbi:MAG: gliding motility-associated C-terminal domain-containing protein [Cyclobacteriaceae bacterium]